MYVVDCPTQLTLIFLILYFICIGQWYLITNIKVTNMKEIQQGHQLGEMGTRREFDFTRMAMTIRMTMRVTMRMMTWVGEEGEVGVMASLVTAHTCL